MKIRTSTKIAIGFGLVIAGGYFGTGFISAQMIDHEHFIEIMPGDVNIVGVDPAAGYRVVVANQMATLVQTQDGFGGKETDDGGATEGAIKKRLPIREMLGTLKGDTKAAGAFIMALNDMKEDETWPPVRVVWTAEDIKKALDGDKVLEKKLTSDINLDLDGKPLPILKFASLENGIIVDSPVTLHVPLNGALTAVMGRVQEPYKPRMIKAVEANYPDNPNVNRSIQAGYYKAEAEKLMAQPKARENIRESLTSRISEKTANGRAEAPDKVLRNAKVVLNDSMITNAHFRTYSTNDGKEMNDLSISLNDEGRKRLWQYSKHRVGSQLLLCADGIAIAAPRIQHELAQGELTITQMADKVLVQTAVDMVNRHVNAPDKGQSNNKGQH